MRLKMLTAQLPSKSHDEDLRIWSKSCGLKEMASELFKTSLWLASFGARAPALIGESLERCFRAQCWCYHIVSSLNGLPTVCLKGSHNDRDQLITGSLHKAGKTLSWMNNCPCAFIKIWVVGMGIWKCACMVNEPHSNTKVKLWSFLAPLPPCQYKDRRKKKTFLHVQIQTTCTISALSCLFPPLCKTGISKDKLVPRQTAATTGGALTCRRRMHTRQR